MHVTPALTKTVANAAEFFSRQTDSIKRDPMLYTLGPFCSLKTIVKHVIVYLLITQFFPHKNNFDTVFFPLSGRYHIVAAYAAVATASGCHTLIISSYTGSLFGAICVTRQTYGIGRGRFSLHSCHGCGYISDNLVAADYQYNRPGAIA